MNHKRFTHWTPRYIYNRISVMIYEKKYPELPWLTKESNHFIKNYINKNHNMLEIGSGRSTVWFSKRVGKLTSLEHNEIWFNHVKKMITSNHTKLVLRNNPLRYIQFINDLKNNTLDICLIDGLERGKTLIAAYKKVKKGGLIIFDDANNYICNPNTYSPYSVKSPLSNVYIEVENLIKNDNLIWTSNGVKDTLLVIKND